MTSQITKHLFVGSLEDAIRVAETDPDAKIISVLEHPLKFEPKSAVNIPIFKMKKNGVDMKYQEHLCLSHGTNWYEHTVEQLREDERSTMPGVHNLGSNKNSVSIIGVEERFREASLLVSKYEEAGEDVLINCMMSKERGPLFLAVHLYWTKYFSYFDDAYGLVKQRHDKTQFRKEWLWEGFKR
jgi:hypothetical protein